jgi:hypothetical protein
VKLDLAVHEPRRIRLALRDQGVEVGRNGVDHRYRLSIVDLRDSPDEAQFREDVRRSFAPELMVIQFPLEACQLLFLLFPLLHDAVQRLLDAASFDRLVESDVRLFPIEHSHQMIAHIA